MKRRSKHKYNNTKQKLPDNSYNAEMRMQSGEHKNSYLCPWLLMYSTDTLQQVIVSYKNKIVSKETIGNV